MEIRRLSKEDFLSKSQLAKQIYRDHKHELGFNEYTTELYVHGISNLEEYPFIIIACDEDKVVGRSGLVIYDAPLREDIYPCILPIHIEDGYEGKGLAKQILDKVIEETEKLTDTHPEHLHVFTILEGFYERFGFEFIQETITHVLLNGESVKKRLYRKKIK